MNQAESNAKLAKVKLALAEKCDRLAKISKSTPRRNTMLHHAARFRRQAADLSRQ
jgi:putative transcriptional regulator